MPRLGGRCRHIIFGTAAADCVIGGAGDDTLYSQGGADIFDYKAPGWGVDQIAGFTTGCRLRFEAASGVTSSAQLNLNIAGGNTQVNHASGVAGLRGGADDIGFPIHLTRKGGDQIE